MRQAQLTHMAVALLLLAATAQAARDVTGPDDIIVGVPNDNDWPSQERPALALDDHTNTKYLHFKGDRVPDAGPTGFAVTPAVGSTVVNGMTFTTANDCPARDPVAFELYGSNDSITGPYTLISRGTIVDFNQPWPWPRNEKTTTPVVFANSTAYRHYQVVFPAIRDPYDSCADSMQIAEVELLAFTYEATAPQPPQGAVVTAPLLLQWTAGDAAAWDDVYLGTTPELTEAHRIATHEPASPAWCQVSANLEPGVTYYWRVDQTDEQNQVHTGTVWHFIGAPNTAYAPSPRDGEKWIAADTILTWTPGQTATAHEVFFSTDRQTVSARAASTFQGRLDAQACYPGPLAAGTTYYWAVDELCGDQRYAGPVWSFTTFAGGGLKAQYFTNMTLSGSPALVQIEDRIDHDWGTGPVVGTFSDGVSARWTADLEIALPGTYTFITTSDDGVRLWLDGNLLIDNWTGHGPMDDYSRPTKLDPGIHNLRLEWYDLWQGCLIQLWWQTSSMDRQIIPPGPLQPPLRATPLYPANAATALPRDLTLTWLAGQSAAGHDIYFGRDPNAVAAATPTDTALYKGRLPLPQMTWAPGPLEANQTYYWRIDEVNPQQPDSPWIGQVYHFTTADFLLTPPVQHRSDRTGAASEAPPVRE